MGCRHYDHCSVEFCHNICVDASVWSWSFATCENASNDARGEHWHHMHSLNRVSRQSKVRSCTDRIVPPSVQHHWNFDLVSSTFHAPDSNQRSEALGSLRLLLLLRPTSLHYHDVRGCTRNWLGYLSIIRRDHRWRCSSPRIRVDFAHS